ncbi:MAG TPA: hypothetical protein DCS66_03350, partial [Flavobacteriaceae bacterium]|nr:hypothetical protein [Flavobacteriaceae bacterium]
NTTGSSNIGIGAYSLENNIDGSNNIAVGYGTMISNTDGSGNIALGLSALSGNTSGNDNTALGNAALYNNTSGIGNTAIGNNALYNKGSGENNVAVGNLSLAALINGDSNIGLGYQVLGQMAAGLGNVAIGEEAGYQNTGGNRNIFLGYNAGYNETGSNKLYIENSNVNANNALIYGEFDNNLLRFNADVEVNTGSLNVDAGTLFVDEVNNRVGAGTVTPDYRFSVNGPINLNEDIASASVAMRVNGAEALWYNGTYFSWGFGATANFFADPIGIGLSAPAYQLELSTNSAAKPTSSAWTVTSDARLKTNVRPFSEGLSVVEKINPVWFTYNGKAGMPTDTGVGTIAQELQKIAPYMVKDWEYKSEDGTKSETYLGVDYGAMDFVLINAVKEQQEIINTQNEKIATLEDRLKKVEALLLKIALNEN